MGKLLLRLGNLLGILNLDPEEFLRGEDGLDLDRSEIDNLIRERETARAVKNWQRADEIRDQLLKMKVVVEDTASGSDWRLER